MVQYVTDIHKKLSYDRGTARGAMSIEILSSFNCGTIEMCNGLAVPWQSHGNGTRIKLNMGMGMNPFPMGIDSHQRLW